MEEYVWISKLTHHPVFVRRVHPVLKQLAQRLGVTVTIDGPRDGSSLPYVEAVRAAVRRKVAGVMVVGWGDEEIVPVVDEAVEKGIPVVAVASDVTGSRRLAFAGTDWYRMGRAMAAGMAEAFGGKGSVLLLGAEATAGMHPAVRAFGDHARGHSGISFVGPAGDPGMTSEGAEEIVAGALDKYPDLIGIAGLSINSGQGAAAALEAAGRSHDIGLFCVDAGEAQIDSIRSGTIDAAFRRGREAFTSFAFEMLNACNHGVAASGTGPGGAKIPGNVDTGFQIVTRANVGTFDSRPFSGELFETFKLSQKLGLMAEVVENPGEMVLVTDHCGRISHISSTTLLGADDRENPEELFRQSQTMEAVGRLAGGVAHDFNNLLSAILGYANIAVEEMAARDPFRHNMEMIGEAANRGAVLTGKLLAFSRKQALRVRIINLNGVIEGMEKTMLTLLGGNVTLELALDRELGNVAADRSRIEKALLDLVLNASDAMPDGGSITISTSNVEVDETLARNLPDVEPGPCVLMEVSDTGHGMDRETGSHVFEPFFTANSKGKGKGLGLSTAWGTVKQHKGHISFRSAPGRGTTFQIYLPRVEKKADGAEQGGAGNSSSRLLGNETVLIVEDEDLVRKVAKKIMEMHGYDVHAASGPKEAIRFCREYGRRIDLLLTDVVMPDMDGLELYAALAPSRPEMRVLYMSGHADKTIIDQETLDPELHFLQKPFTVETLAWQTRAVLDRAQEGMTAD